MGMAHDLDLLVHAGDLLLLEQQLCLLTLPKLCKFLHSFLAIVKIKISSFCN